MSKKIKFAVIGCGHIGKRHAEMITRNTDCELVALVDVKDEDKLGIDDYKSAKFFSSIDSLLSDPISEQIDVINIATPNGLHADQAIQALNAGKHVVIEKPISLSKSDAEKIIFTALQKQKLVFCVMQNRYSPPSQWIKSVLDQNLMGKIFMVQLNCYWNRDHRYYKADSWHGHKDLDGGTLYTQFSHFIDLMYWLFGDIKNIQSRLTNFNHAGVTQLREDSGIVNFDFDSGAIGCINFSTSVWDRNLESSMTIIGEKGSVKIGGQYMDKVEVCHIQDYEMPELPPTNPGNDYGAYKGSAANHHYVIDNVVEVIQKNQPITTNALEGLKVVDIIERIYKS